MLNRKTLEVGAVVVVGQVRSGLRGAVASATQGFTQLSHLGVTPQPGSFLITGEAQVTEGARLRIVDLPRKRNGITTAVVEILDGPAKGMVGHVYWCTLQASCSVERGPAAKA